MPACSLTTNQIIASLSFSVTLPRPGGGAFSYFGTASPELKQHVVFLDLLGFFYNIIRVPPPKDNAAKQDSADLTGAQVICSIPAAEPRKPSYYHSFGEMYTQQHNKNAFNYLHGKCKVKLYKRFWSEIFYVLPAVTGGICLTGTFSVLTIITV